ncbi:hypothetical protein N9B20_01160 [Mariniblastus sp.]|nr:hypothetical protein [Mariniblastus sp.]
MTLVKELIHIPEQIPRGKFVLKRTDHVKNLDSVVDSYVTT